MRLSIALHSHSNHHARILARLALPAILLFTMLAGPVTPVLAATSPPHFLTMWGSTGTGDGEFHQPHGVAVDSDGNVYVVDMDNSRVQKFLSDGTFVTELGNTARTDGLFQTPLDVAVDSTGAVYVSEFIGRVQKFTYNSGNSTYEYAATVGTYGTGDGYSIIPPGSAWTPRTTSTWPIPTTTASRSSTAAARSSPSLAALTPATIR